MMENAKCKAMQSKAKQKQKNPDKKHVTKFSDQARTYTTRNVTFSCGAKRVLLLHAVCMCGVGVSIPTDESGDEA